MDRIRGGMFALIVILLLSACMSEAETDDNGETEVPPEEEEPEDPEDPEEKVMPAQEVLQRSINEMESIESYTIATNMNQQIELNPEETVENKYRSNTLVNLEPLRYHQTATIEKRDSAPEDAANSLVGLERYFTEEGFYIFDSSEGRWVQFPEQFTEDFQSYDKSFESPAHILEMIEAYSSEIEVVEGNRHYQLTFNGNDEQTQQIALEMMGMVNTDFSTSMEDMMYMTEIGNLTYELQIDKETFYAKKLKMNLEMNMNSEEGNGNTSTHVIVARYSDLDETEDISIPVDVLDRAEEMELEEFSGFDDMEEFDSIDGIEMDEIYENEESASEEESILDFDLSEYLNGEEEKGEEDTADAEESESK
ncbi:DUF6612 family protein [Salibacterium aidingense]|uniref:DUF6612 family protein n=1 Tax=Salibacterium aidingense TaxID=384933 RepID=UPI003BD6887E